MLRAEPLIRFCEDDAAGAWLAGKYAAARPALSLEGNAADRDVELFFDPELVSRVFIPMAEGEAAGVIRGEELLEVVEGVDGDCVLIAEFGRFDEESVLDLLEKLGDVLR